MGGKPVVGPPPLLGGKVPTQVAAGAADPARMRSGELRPHIPKPRAISTRVARPIQPVGPQKHYKPRRGF
jgi:hypothetical protein